MLALFNSFSLYFKDGRIDQKLECAPLIQEDQVKLTVRNFKIFTDMKKCGIFPPSRSVETWINIVLLDTVKISKITQYFRVILSYWRILNILIKCHQKLVTIWCWCKLKVYQQHWTRMRQPYEASKFKTINWQTPCDGRHDVNLQQLGFAFLNYQPHYGSRWTPEV